MEINARLAVRMNVSHFWRPGSFARIVQCFEV
jgi:hypothetical protein